MPAWFTAVFPVVTLLLGAGAAFAREAFMQSRQDRREALARQHERRAAAVDRREEFELQHLVEVNGLLRDAEQAVRRFAKRYRVKDPTPEQRQGQTDSAVEFHTATAALDAQVGFVLDDEVRSAAEEARDELRQLFEDFRLHRKRYLFNSGDKTSSAYSALASRVRAIYAGRGQAGPPELP